MADRFGFGAALFSVKCFIAAMLAYYIALRIGLTRPYWAITTSYIVAQPLAGAVVSKALFRVAGTILGAAAAVILVPNLVNAPELLSLALALWLGLCLYIALQDRTPRSYVFLLAGYTASIIGFPSVAQPGSIFQTAILRVQEISLGILCGSFVHALILPQSVTGRLLSRVDVILADVERWSRDSLAGQNDAQLDRDRRRLALDIAELHQLSIHLPFDTARFLPRVRTVRAFQDQLSLLLPLASAVEDRITEMRAAPGGVPGEVARLVEDTRAWLNAPPASIAAREEITDDLIARARALEPVITAPLSWRDAILLSLVSRLAELIAAHRAIRDLREQLRSPTRTLVSSAVAEAMRASSRRVFHRDRPIAARAAAGTVVTVLLGCTFWIGTGWADGAGAVLIAGVACALFGTSDNPAPVIMTFLWGSIIGTMIGGVYLYAIMPQVTDFVTLAAVLAPPLLLAGALLANPNTMLITLGGLLGSINLMGLNDHYGEPFGTFANGALAQTIGTVFAVVTVGLFQTVGAARTAERIIRAGWRDLARRSDLRGPTDVMGWISKMLDRVGLLAPRLAARGDDPGKPLLDALQDLRVGVSVANLRDVRATSDAQGDALATEVLSRVSRHYAALRVDTHVADDPGLLVAIDRALDGFAADAEPARRRAAMLALVSLRRNLFPAAPDFRAGTIGEAMA